jgi:hypothetical protein
MPHQTDQSTSHPSDGLLLRAIDLELAPQQATEVDSHLASCDRCRCRRERLESMSADLRSIAGAKGDDAAGRAADLRRRLIAKMAAAPASRTSWSLLSTARTAALVAAIVGLTGVLLLRGPLHWGRASTSIEAAARPIHALTPGAVEPIALADICAGRTPLREAVSADVRQAILHDYGMENLRPEEYELDYLITPELGGSSDRKNLWPEQYESRVWNARVKDDPERLLPALVCQGSLDLATAQRDIATDWIAAYQKYFHTDQPIRTRADRDADEDRDDDVKLMSLAMPANPLPWK